MTLNQVIWENLGFIKLGNDSVPDAVKRTLRAITSPVLSLLNFRTMEDRQILGRNDAMASLVWVLGA
jgi:hypothetical protein